MTFGVDSLTRLTKTQVVTSTESGACFPTSQPSQNLHCTRSSMRPKQNKNGENPPKDHEIVHFGNNANYVYLDFELSRTYLLKNLKMHSFKGFRILIRNP